MGGFCEKLLEASLMSDRAETTCDELTATPTPRPPCTACREEIEKIGSEVRPGKKDRVEGMFF